MAYITIKGHDYKVIGKDTKFAYRYMRSYHRSEGSLFQAYGRPSNAKIEAWEKICRRLTNVRITGAGTWQFSCAGMLEDEDGRRHFVIETPCYSFIVIDGWEYI